MKTNAIKDFFEKSYNVLCSLCIAKVEENFENHIERSILKKNSKYRTTEF